MKKIKLLFYILLFQYFLFIPNTFAVVSSKDVQTTNENISIISSFFTKDLLINIVFATIVFIGTFFISKILTAKLTNYLERSSEGEGKNKEELIGVLSRTVNITVLTIGFLITLGILGFDTSILMGGIGFGVGFALKIFLTNFVSGILMVTQGYYHNGDLVKIGDQLGKIKNINALFTSIQQFDGVIFYVPNVKFMEENVSNYYANDKRRIEINVGVDYETDLYKAKEIMLRVLDNFPNILKSPEAKIYVIEFGESSINLSLRFWIATGDKFFATKSNITETINLAFRKHGITIPFPQVTLSNRNNFKTIIDKEI